MSPYAAASPTSAPSVLTGRSPVYDRTVASSARASSALSVPPARSLPSALSTPYVPSAPSATRLVREDVSADPSPEVPAAPVLPRLARLLAGTPPDPWSDPDSIEELEGRIVRLAGHMHAAEQRFLLMLAEFDWRRGWELSGHRTCAEWLSERTGYDLGACRERVRTARKLVGLPLTTEAMGRGELSFSQVRALTRVATAENEGELLELAKGVPTRKLEAMVRGWKRDTKQTEEERAQDLYQSRRLSIFPDEEGMYLIRGKLPVEVGLVVQKAIQAAMEQLFREGVGKGPDLREVEVRQREAARLRADALGLAAERVLGVGMGSRGGDETGAESNADAGQAAPPAPVSGSQAERFQVMLRVDEAVLGGGEQVGEATRSAGEQVGPVAAASGGDAGDGSGGEVGAAAAASHSHLEDGTRISAETSRRICCDAGVSEVRLDAEGHPLDVGRRRRTIPPALRRALELRDRGCRFPGCPVRHFTAGHHLRHWAQGGETKLDNLLLLCSYHHRLVHEGGWNVQWQDRGRPIFLDPRGRPHFDGRWKLPRLDGVDGAVAGGMVADGTAVGSMVPGGAVADGEVGEGAVGSGSRAARTRGEGSPLDPLARLIADNHRLNGTAPDGSTASIRWMREEDIPAEVYFPAVEAMGEALGEVRADDDAHTDG